MRYVKQLMALFMLSVLPIIQTQAEDPPAPVPVPPVRGILGMEAGDYSFVMYDKGKLQSEYLKIFDERAKADRDYFIKAIDRIETSFIDFIKTRVYGDNGLKKLSDRAKGAAEFYPATEYLDAINGYMEGELEVRSKIRTITSIAETFPSQVAAPIEGADLKDIPSYGNMDFSPLVTFYNEQMDAITKFVSNLQHNVKLANGNEHIIPEGSGGGLVLAAPSVLLPPEKIREMNEKIMTLSMWSPKADDKINTYTNRVKQLVQEFKRNFGTDEKWRPRGDHDIKARDDAFRDIVIAFWSRSYLRVAYGVPLGAIGISYTKRVAKIDRFTVATDALSRFHEEPVWLQKDLMTVIEAYRQALQTIDARAAKVLDGDTPFLSRINSFITLLGGMRPTAEVLQMVLQLMAADADEERIIITEADALATLFARYQARYFANEDMEAQFKALRKAYDPSDESGQPAEAEEKNPFGNTEVLSGGAIRTEFANVLLEAKLKETELELARQMRQTIANAVRANNFSKERNKRKDRM